MQYIHIPCYFSSKSVAEQNLLQYSRQKPCIFHFLYFPQPFPAVGTSPTHLHFHLPRTHWQEMTQPCMTLIRGRLVITGGIVARYQHAWERTFCTWSLERGYLPTWIKQASAHRWCDKLGLTSSTMLGWNIPHLLVAWWRCGPAGLWNRRWCGRSSHLGALHFLWIEDVIVVTVLFLLTRQIESTNSINRRPCCMAMYAPLEKTKWTKHLVIIPVIDMGSRREEPSKGSTSSMKDEHK